MRTATPVDRKQVRTPFLRRRFLRRGPVAGPVKLVTAVAVAAACSGVAAAGASTAGRGHTTPGTGTTPPALLLSRATNWLLGAHVTTAGGPWAWRSVIQARHLQTDRDVGTASVLTGLLAAYAVTHQQADLAGARRAGDWLLSVADRGTDGLSWPDWVDGPRGQSPVSFTSFDDGAPGIADALWRLGRATGDQRYLSAALQAMRWEETRAQRVRSAPCPGSMCRWPFFLRSGRASADYEVGIGEGATGVVFAFMTFARRASDPQFARYALAGARYVESLITAKGALPERQGTHEYDTGYLSGAAGAAFMFLRLYQRTGDPRWLKDARRLLHWITAHRASRAGGTAWPIEISPTPELENRELASGIEEGAAGIGWVELQAYRATGDRRYLQTAVSAGDWLLATALRAGSAMFWAEDYGRESISTSLDNGAAGIGWFLYDLAQASGQTRFGAAAIASERWLAAVSRGGPSATFWAEHYVAGAWTLTGEPSWHWGSAGIIAFLARLRGWPVDMPGEEPASRRPGVARSGVSPPHTGVSASADAAALTARRD